MKRAHQRDQATMMGLTPHWSVGAHVLARPVPSIKASDPMDDWGSRLRPLTEAFGDVEVSIPFEEMEGWEMDEGWKRPPLRVLVTEWAEADIIFTDATAHRENVYADEENRVHW